MNFFLPFVPSRREKEGRPTDAGPEQPTQLSAVAQLFRWAVSGVRPNSRKNSACAWLKRDSRGKKIKSASAACVNRVVQGMGDAYAKRVLLTAAGDAVSRGIASTLAKHGCR